MKMHPFRVTLAVVGGASLVVGAVGAWYAFTPAMTVEAMATAAIAGDGERVASYMDMEALRKDVRRQASSAIARNYPQGRVMLKPEAITEALVGSVIDRAFSLDGTKRMLKRSQREMPTREDVAYTILRDGPNHFIARLDRPRRVDLHFTRHAAGWLLSRITSRPAVERRNLV